MKLDLSFLKSALPNGYLFTNKKLVPLTNLTTLPTDSTTCTVSIDTRTLVAGQLFIAMQGENVNGHDYLSAAIAKGACGIVVQESYIQKLAAHPNNTPVLVVPDTHQALLDLARVWRKRFTYPVVAVTGSVGKTTTKEILRSIFTAAGLPACVSHKNQNTLIFQTLQRRSLHSIVRQRQKG